MAVDKRCAASGRALQAESAASEIQNGKIHLRKTLQNRSKCMHERRFAVISSLQLYNLCKHRALRLGTDNSPVLAVNACYNRDGTVYSRFRRSGKKNWEPVIAGFGGLRLKNHEVKDFFSQSFSSDTLQGKLSE